LNRTRRAGELVDNGQQGTTEAGVRVIGENEFDVPNIRGPIVAERSVKDGHLVGHIFELVVDPLNRERGFGGMTGHHEQSDEQTEPQDERPSANTETRGPESAPRSANLVFKPVWTKPSFAGRSHVA
jgi:hypothetical protein